MPPGDHVASAVDAVGIGSRLPQTSQMPSLHDTGFSGRMDEDRDPGEQEEMDIVGTSGGHNMGIADPDPGAGDHR